MDYLVLHHKFLCHLPVPFFRLKASQQHFHNLVFVLLIVSFPPEYFDSLTASAINYKNDDDFNYYFDFIGRPPNGINYFIEHRRIYFSGVPTEKGVFSFSIQLSIGEGIIVPDDGICFGDDSTSKTYSITIN